jgi:uncharacterized repeat protein (TIGR02543 family)
MRKFSLFIFPLFCGAMLAAGAASAQAVDASGTTGSCTWTLTGAANNLTLTISGAGAMENYEYGAAVPWNSYVGNIKTLSIGQGVTAIGDYAFYYCLGLTSVTIPASVTSIGSGAFVNCSGLTSINVDAANTAYTSENGVLFNKSKTTLICCPVGKIGNYTIPMGVTAIGEYAFWNCRGLTSVTIPAGVTSIGCYAFFNCHGLTSMTIPASVAAIGNNAFGLCRGLTSVTIPAGVTTIGSYAFAYCSGLTSVTIPASVTAIGANPFPCCSSLTSINVDAANTAYTSENGVLFNKSKTTLICCPAGKTGSYTIPALVTAIGDVAFFGCSDLTSVTIPASVTAIGESAFSDCSGLTSVTNLSLTPQSINSNVFIYVNKATCTLRVPASTEAAYQSANAWNEFKTIQAVTLATLTFNAAEGTVSPASMSVAQSSPVGSLPVPERSGYTFGGWFTEQNGGGTEYTAATTATGSLTLYAKWQAAATGVSNPLAASVSLYPNPFSAEVRLTGAAGCTLTVVTAAGAVVHTQKVAGAAETISLGKLPSGVYFFRLEKDGKKTIKIMIND